MKNLLDLTFFIAIVITSIFGVLFLIANAADFKAGLITYLSPLF